MFCITFLTFLQTHVYLQNDLRQYPLLLPLSLHHLIQLGHPLSAVATSADTVQNIRKKYIASSLHFCSQDLEPFEAPLTIFFIQHSRHFISSKHTLKKARYTSA